MRLLIVNKILTCSVLLISFMFSEVVLGLSIKPSSFNDLVDTSDYISKIVIVEGEMLSGMEGFKNKIVDNKYCGISIKNYKNLISKEKFCFNTGRKLKISSKYLAFLYKHKHVNNIEEITYILGSSYEVIDKNQYHDFEAIKWMPIRDPLINSLSENNAKIQYYKDGEEYIENEQSASFKIITLYWYYKMSEVENLLEELLKSQNKYNTHILELSK